MDSVPDVIEEDDEVTADGLNNRAIDAATDYLAFCGNMYGWWPTLNWRDLDPIGRDEFSAVVANIIREYVRIAKEQPSDDLDELIYYYVSRGWPSYTEFEKRLKPEWSDKLMKAQEAALQRHRDRIKLSDTP